MKEDNFLYQLTDWELKKEHLEYATESFKKYNRPYVIRCDAFGRVAVFTEGKHITFEENEGKGSNQRIRYAKLSIVSSFENGVVVDIKGIYAYD